MSNYYNENAKIFFEGTVATDMSEQYKMFLELLPKGANILDAGCGSGRDSLAFKKLGYQVTAIDASEELCKLASEYIGQEVKQIRFQDLDFENAFDGIWACATLLHVSSQELPQVIQNLKRALKPGDILYASFKYGDFEGERNGRYFHDLTEEKAQQLFTEGGLKVKKMWITGDVREGRGDEKWVNLLCNTEVCILEKNKAKLWEVAKKNNKYNEKGQCLITKQDEDYTHDEWEDDGK